MSRALLMCPRRVSCRHWPTRASTSPASPRSPACCAPMGRTPAASCAKAPEATRPPTTHSARAPREVWCWDMTYLPANVLARWFYPYLVLVLYNRKIVGWEMRASGDSEHAAHLVRRTALAGHIATLETKPVLRVDNGSTVEATTVLTLLKRLGVKPSYSGSRVSDDNPTPKCCFAQPNTSRSSRPKARWRPRLGGRLHASVQRAPPPQRPSLRQPGPATRRLKLFVALD